MNLNDEVIKVNKLIEEYTTFRNGVDLFEYGANSLIFPCCICEHNEVPVKECEPCRHFIV